ncbi:SpoIIIAH-like family protein [Candidatus Epulonipiscium viviparus]|uniref:SpoIIIAH-like family protein n=1 Tax=Candidatus Epulonipiscium viviparus TaxID=420336 RepID=UPI00016BFC6A|nr:SpoIIIAH-like family protein [Candidatus Epulopiscium viviparus]
MLNFKRNQLIITVLVFMIAIGGYLQLTTDPQNLPAFVNEDQTEDIKVQEQVTDINYFEKFLTLPPDMEDSDMVTDETLQNTTMLDGATGMEVIITKADGSQNVSSTNVAAVSYFAEEKMIREQQRSTQIEELNEYIANSAIDENSKSKAAQSLLNLQDKIEKENGSESLLRAKGFSDVYVRMDETAVDVIVNRPQLTDAEIAQIEEIVSRTTGYRVSQIKIHINS